MIRVKEISFSDDLDRAWRHIFKSNDPFSDVFSDSVEQRVLLYPTSGYHLSERQYQALIEAIRIHGEIQFYTSIVEYDGDFLRKGQHWSCMLPDYSEYIRIPLVLENSLYSANGVFGLMVSHEDHALVGGRKEFIETLKNRYPTWEEDRALMENEWDADISKPVLEATSF